MEKKDTRITIRLTPEQYKSICERAATAHMSPSTYIRAAAMRHKVVVVDGLKEFTKELKHIGHNINQLTILAHEGKVNIANLNETVKTLEQIYNELQNLSRQEQS